MKEGLNLSQKVNDPKSEKHNLWRGRIVKTAVAAITAAAIFGSAACGVASDEENIAVSEQLKEQGFMDGRLMVDLVYLKPVFGSETDGRVLGLFTFVYGKVEGKDTRMLQFAWEGKEDANAIRISEVPLSKVEIRLAEEQDAQPTAEISVNKKDGHTYRTTDGRRYFSVGGKNRMDIIENADTVALILSQKDINQFLTSLEETP